MFFTRPQKSPALKFLHPYVIFAIFLCIIGITLEVVENATPSVIETSAKQVWLPAEPMDPGLRQINDAPPISYVSAHAAIVLENTTGTVLYAKNAHEKRAPASTTKILTALIALEKGNLNDVVTVSRKAASTTGSSARLYTGQKIRLEDLLHGLLLSSGNDAAVAVAEHLAGDVNTFAVWMTKRAKELGASNSQFKNPHGLDEAGHYSTAYDLALLARMALLHPLFAKIVQTKMYDSSGGSWSNTNKLLWQVEGSTGIKTGTTSKAGYCLVASVEQEGMQLITVVLNAGDRYRETSALLQYGFDHFRILTLAQRGDPLARLQLSSGVEPIIAVANEPLTVVVPNERVSHVYTQFILDPALKAPIRRGRQIGTIDVLIDGETAHSIPLVAQGSVAARTPWVLFKSWWTTTFKPPRAEPSLP